MGKRGKVQAENGQELSPRVLAKARQGLGCYVLVWSPQIGLFS